MPFCLGCPGPMTSGITPSLHSCQNPTCVRSPMCGSEGLCLRRGRTQKVSEPALGNSFLPSPLRVEKAAPPSAPRVSASKGWQFVGPGQRPGQGNTPGPRNATHAPLLKGRNSGGARPIDRDSVLELRPFRARSALRRGVPGPLPRAIEWMRFRRAVRLPQRGVMHRPKSSAKNAATALSKSTPSSVAANRSDAGSWGRAHDQTTADRLGGFRVSFSKLCPLLWPVRKSECASRLSAALQMLDTPGSLGQFTIF